MKHVSNLKQNNLLDAQPSKTFEKQLRAKFISAALPNNTLPKMVFMRKQAWFLSVVFTLVAFIFAGFGIQTNYNRSVAAQTFQQVYSKSSQSALMPVFASINKLPAKDLQQAMNIANFPLQKDSYGTATTTKIIYGTAYNQCADLFKFDSSISKIVTFEFYKDSVYKFKTHIFDQQNNEIDLLIFNGQEYFSQTQQKDLSSGAANFSNIQNFIPGNLYQPNNAQIAWEDKFTCNGETKTLVNNISYNSQNIIESFEISIKDSTDLVYRAAFETQPMTIEQLTVVDEIFKGL